MSQSRAQARPPSLVVQARPALRLLLAMFMVGIGVLHFTADDLFVQLVPPSLPWPHALVWSSGVFEVLLGVTLLNPSTRRLAGGGLVALYVAVFPANIYMAFAHLQIQGLPSWIAQPSAAALWLRLPFQAVFIGWALYSAEIWAPRA